MSQIPSSPRAADGRKIIRIGTRESKLAMWQALYVKDLMEQKNPDLVFEIVGMTTTGDNILNQPLSSFENKGIFTKELDIALLNNTVDVVVHCVKDLPTILPEGIGFAAIMQRESPEDCVILHPKHREKYQQFLQEQSATYGTSLPTSSSTSDLNLPELTGDSNRPKICPALSFLPNGAIIGTSALRRQATLARYHPHLVCKDVRGNVGTRLAKLDAGDYDAIILAKIGVERLGLADRIDSVLNSDHYLHAVGQAALAIACREHDEEMKLLFMTCLHNIPSALACTIERGMLNALQGGCKVPICCATKYFIVPNNVALQHQANINTYRNITKAIMTSERETRIQSAITEGKDFKQIPVETSLIPQHLWDGVLSIHNDSDLRDLIIQQNKLIHQNDSDNDSDDEDYTDDEGFTLQQLSRGVAIANSEADVRTTPTKKPIKRLVPLTPRTRAQTYSLLTVTRAAVLSMDGQNYIETIIAGHFPLYLKSQFMQPISSKAWSIGMELGYELNDLGADQVLEHIRCEAHEEVIEQKNKQ